MYKFVSHTKITQQMNSTITVKFEFEPDYRASE